MAHFVLFKYLSTSFFKDLLIKDQSLKTVLVLKYFLYGQLVLFPYLFYSPFFQRDHQNVFTLETLRKAQSLMVSN